MEVTVEVKDLVKAYKSDVKVLNNVSYEFEKGKFYAVMSRSGAGKSTLLNIIGTIDNADDREVFINGNNISKLTEKEKANLRMKNLGFVFRLLSKSLSKCFRNRKSVTQKEDREHHGIGMENVRKLWKSAAGL